VCGSDLLRLGLSANSLEPLAEALLAFERQMTPTDSRRLLRGSSERQEMRRVARRRDDVAERAHDAQHDGYVGLAVMHDLRKSHLQKLGERQRVKDDANDARRFVQRS